MSIRKCIAPSRFKLVVSPKLEAKIRFMCDKFPQTEWSGILFYRESEGNVDDRTLSLTAEDFCLLDVGTSSYTEYETGSEVLEYQMENDLLDCWWSIIHSHNSFSTFFSGTDMDTLKKLGQTMNHCLSLIVNNAGEYNARLTRIVNETIHCSSDAKYNSFNNEEKSFKYEYTAPRDAIEWIPAEISKMEPYELSQEEKSSLSEKIDTIIKAKEEKNKLEEKHFGWHDEIWLDSWTPWKTIDFDDTNKNTNDIVHDNKLKRVVYSLITGDLFPQKRILKLNIDEIIKKSLEVYRGKSSTISSYMNDCDDFEIFDYTQFIISLFDINETEFEAIIEIFNNYSIHSRWLKQLSDALSYIY